MAEGSEEAYVKITRWETAVRWDRLPIQAPRSPPQVKPGVIDEGVELSWADIRASVIRTIRFVNVWNPNNTSSQEADYTRNPSIPNQSEDRKELAEPSYTSCLNSASG